MRAVERLAPRRASIGSTRVAIHAGAMPKATPVISETPKANSSTGMEGDALMGTPAKPRQRGECKMQNQARAGKCDRQTRRAAQQREQDAFGEGLPHEPRRSRPQRHAQRYLPPPLHAANEHEIGDVGADDEQHKSGNHHQDLQPVLIFLAHAGDAGASGAQEQGLLGKFRAIVGAHLAPVRAQPLLQLHSHFSLYGCGVRARLDAADQVQPVSVVLVQIGIGLHERFGVQRQKEIGRSVAQSVAKETRRSDSHHGKWLVIQIEDAADNGRIRSILLLP